MKLDFEPSCRYGHGALNNVSKVVHTDFALGGVDFIIDKHVMATEQFFSVQVFVCTTCGYMELFDSDVKGTADLVKGAL